MFLFQRRMRWAAVLLLIAVTNSHAAVRLPALISDNMILQADVAAPVYGWADAGEKVTVTIHSQTVSTTTDSNGRWRVDLAPMKPGGPYELLVSGTNSITVKNVVVGEIWLCSGQSQMEQSMRFAPNRGVDIPAANDELFRIFLVDYAKANTIQDDVPGHWAQVTPHSIMQGGWHGFSMIGYYFGQELRRKLNVPVGMIEATKGGTPIEVWMDWDLLQSMPEARGFLDMWATKMKQYNPRRNEERYQAALTAWRKKLQEAETAGTKPPVKPNPPTPPNMMDWYPSTRYNAMVAPLAPYAFRGVLWYQGYSSRYIPDQYRALFPAMIRSWRQRFGHGDLPFYFVQHANFATRGAKPGDRPRLAEIRDSQLTGLGEPNTAVIVTLDLGDSGGLHYHNKQPVAHRLAMAALGLTYHRLDGTFLSPVYRDMKVTVDGDGQKRVLLTFDHVGDGLRTRNNGPVGGFVIADQSMEFVPAKAEIVGKNVIAVYADGVSSPVAARYAWQDDPQNANVVNSADLPLGTFRTDQGLLHPSASMEEQK